MIQVRKTRHVEAKALQVMVTLDAEENGEGECDLPASVVLSIMDVHGETCKIEVAPVLIEQAAALLVKARRELSWDERHRSVCGEHGYWGSTKDDECPTCKRYKDEAERIDIQTERKLRDSLAAVVAPPVAPSGGSENWEAGVDAKGAAEPEQADSKPAAIDPNNYPF